MKQFKAECVEKHISPETLKVWSETVASTMLVFDIRTDSGKGASMSLSRPDARRLRDYLTRWLDGKPGKEKRK